MTIEGSPKITITPQIHDAGFKVNFGATVTGCDLNNLDEPTFKLIGKAIYKHTVIVVKGQNNLLPNKQFDFVQRLDPDARAEHGWGTSKEATEATGITGKLKWYTIPGTAGVQLIGHGYQGDDHYGLRGITMKGVGHASYQANILPDEDLARGDTRFGIFHFDGIVYGAHPSRVTTLRHVRLPKGPPLTVRWDDGTGRTMQAQPGGTAFYSNAQLYSLLTDEERSFVDNSYWEPAPYPFMWTGNRKTRSTGLGLAPGGEVLSLDELPPWSADKVHKYPMVWVNPVTGERGFQVRAEVVRKLYVKASPSAEERVVEDPEAIRTWLNNIFDRILAPEYINIPPVEEGDVVVWNNWGAMHSAIEYPETYGVRTIHQCHIASSTPPPGPSLQTTPVVVK